MTIQRESYTTSDCQSRDVSPGPVTPSSWSLAHITQDPLKTENLHNLIMLAPNHHLLPSPKYPLN